MKMLDESKSHRCVCMGERDREGNGNHTENVKEGQEIRKMSCHWCVEEMYRSAGGREAADV